jgi:hypothetical protein
MKIPSTKNQIPMNQIQNSKQVICPQVRAPKSSLPEKGGHSIVIKMRWGFWSLDIEI